MTPVADLSAGSGRGRSELHQEQVFGALHVEREMRERERTLDARSTTIELKLVLEAEDVSGTIAIATVIVVATMK